MYMFIRKYGKVRSVADAARRAKSGIGQILKECTGSGLIMYYGGEGVGVAVMIFEDRESANAANDKVREFVQASLHDLDLGDPEIIAGEVLVNRRCVMSADEQNAAIGSERKFSSNSDQPRCASLMVAIGHFPSWPRIEIRKPAIHPARCSQPCRPCRL